MDDLRTLFHAAAPQGAPVDIDRLRARVKQRRRQRLRRSVAAGLAVIAAAGVAAAGALAGGGPSRVQVGGPPPTKGTSAPAATAGGSSPLGGSRPVFTTVTRGGVTVRLKLDNRTIEAGGVLRGTLTVTTHQPIRRCLWWALSLTSPATGPQAPAIGTSTCPPSPDSGTTVTMVPAGTTSYPVDQRAIYEACTRTPAQATRQVPACGANGMPDLPAGRYSVQLVTSASLPVPAPVTVTIAPSPTGLVTGYIDACRGLASPPGPPPAHTGEPCSPSTTRRYSGPSKSPPDTNTTSFSHPGPTRSSCPTTRAATSVAK